MGNAGQTTYGAANACAEASSLAARRAGTPACVARWGAWAGGGMASSGGNIDVEARMRRVGLGLLDPNDGLRALAHLLGGRRAALVVCPFDWSRYADRHPDAAKSSFLANGCLANARGMNRDGSDAARDILDAEGPSVAASKIPIDDASKIPMNVRARASATAQRVVVEVTTRLLGAPPEPNAPLLDAGLDSLSSAELADALETAVRVERAAANPACAPLAPFSATLAFDHPTPNALVAFLAPALEEAYARDFDVVHDEETIAATSIGCAPRLPSPDRSASIPTTLVTSLGGETASNASMSLESRAHRSTDGASRTPGAVGTPTPSSPTRKVSSSRRVTADTFETSPPLTGKRSASPPRRRRRWIRNRG